MTRLLVTRPREDAAPFAETLSEFGIQSLVDPLLEIRYLDDVALPLEGVQAILLTSRNGARALARATRRRDLPVLAVGDSTAALAREQGFGAVASAAGDVHALAEMARARLDPGSGALVHVAGTSAAGDLSGRLAAAGFDCRRVSLYEARPAERLGQATTAALRAGGLDGAVFFSPRTAASFARLVTVAALAGTCRRLQAYCLSEAVAAAARPLPWRALSVADRPDQSALLRLLQSNHEEP